MSSRALTAVAVAGGAAAGYLAERATLGPRLAATASAARDPGTGTPLGQIAGETREVAGPDGVRLLVESYGPAGAGGDGGVDAPTIVFAHGWTNTRRVWHEQVAGLSDRFRLVTYDQPGHGLSSRSRTQVYDMDLFGDALAAVVDSLPGTDPIVLCGHSLGGMTVMNFARRYPDLFDRVASVLLLATTSRAIVDDVKLGFGVHAVARIERRVRRLFDLVRPSAVALAETVYQASTDLSYLITREVALTSDAESRYVDFTEQLLLDSDFDMVTGVIAPILSLDEDESLAGIDVPTTIVVGSRDRLTPVGLSRRMADRCPTADLMVLRGYGHMIQLEAHDVVNDLLEHAAERVRTAA